MRKPLVACVAFTIVALAAGCAGGGSGGVTPPVGGGGGSAGSANAPVTIAIPPRPATALSRSPQYVSPNTASIGIVVTPQGGTPYPAVIANVPGTSCIASEAGGYTCTINVTATYGVDTVAITAYSAANAGGSILSSGSITSTFSASASPSPALSAVLTGVVKGIAMSIVHNAIQDGYVPVGQSATLNVTALDASGATIIGTYDGPIAAALPSNSGLTLGTTSFADSSHTTSTITWSGAPTYYNAPTATVDITASASGGAVTGSAKFHPLTTLLSMPAGDGGPNAVEPFGLVHDGPAFVVGTADQFFDNGEIASFDPTTGAQTVSPALGYEPNALYRDKFGGTWVSDSNGGSGILHCYTSPSSSDAPVPVSTAGPSDPYDMVVDGSNRLWFTSDGNVGYVVVNGACTTSSTFASFQTLPYNVTSPYAQAVIADRSIDATWAVDSSNLQLDQFYDGSPTGSPLATGFYPSSAGYDGGDQIAIGGLDGNTEQGVLGIIEQDSTAFSSTYELYANAGVGAIDAIHAGADSPIAFADTDYGGLGLYYPATPALSTFVPLPQPGGTQVATTPARARHRSAGRRAQSFTLPSYCAGVAFDGVGMPWGACGVGGHAAMERLVLTSEWSAFEDADGMLQGNQAKLGIAGGTAATTFTLVCSSGLTCTPDTAESRVFLIHANATGPASITVDGSDGRSQTFTFTVGINTT